MNTETSKHTETHQRSRCTQYIHPDKFMNTQTQTNARKKHTDNCRKKHTDKHRKKHRQTQYIHPDKFMNTQTEEKTQTNTVHT